MNDKFYDRKKIIEIIKKNRNDINDEKIEKELPNGYFVKCENCNEIIIFERFKLNFFCCIKCDFHHFMPINERLYMLFDNNYNELQSEHSFKNPINFPNYVEKLNDTKNKTGYNEAITWGEGIINNYKIVYFILNPKFLMASMGSYVGEQIYLAFEYATKNGLPILGISASGGARMQEGIISLMQMAKTISAVKEHSKKNLLYISLLTNPTTGGVSASFALLGDINLAEPKALIGFAGPRVIKETIGEELPNNFQKSEFLEEKGFVDMVINRNNQKEIITKILKLHNINKEL